MRAEDSPAIERYLEDLPSDRGAIMGELRNTILRNLPPGYVERFADGMICYEIPLRTYSKTYNGRPLLLAALASKKSFVTLYLMAIYGDADAKTWFRKIYAASGKKLDMGRSCVHFKSVDDIPTQVIARAIAKVPVPKYIAIYERARRRRK